MGRWEPDARGRMRRAAMELYAERGYEQTTVADIADRAGVTERTYFRHFADKREVLFDGSDTLQAAILSAIAAAPPSTSPLDNVGAAVRDAVELVIPAREMARARAAVVSANPALQERELLKLATLGVVCAEALRARGVDDLGARVAAQAGVMAFAVGFDRWIAGLSSPDLSGCIGEALDELRRAAAAD